MHPLNVVAVVVEKDVDCFEEKIAFCFLKPNRLVSVVPEIKLLR